MIIVNYEISSLFRFNFIWFNGWIIVTKQHIDVCTHSLRPARQNLCRKPLGESTPCPHSVNCDKWQGNPLTRAKKPTQDREVARRDEIEHQVHTRSRWVWTASIHTRWDIPRQAQGWMCTWCYLSVMCRFFGSSQKFPGPTSQFTECVYGVLSPIVPRPRLSARGFRPVCTEAYLYQFFQIKISNNLFRSNLWLGNTFPTSQIASFCTSQRCTSHVQPRGLPTNGFIS